MQYPSDLMVMQELISQIKPLFIVETGVAFGGMTTFYADMLRLCGGEKVIGIDVDIRPHAEQMFMERNDERIVLVRGSSIDEKTAQMVKERVNYAGNIIVSLDSNHTHEHVLQELKLYAPLVSIGSYIVVFDTEIEEYWHYMNRERPWGPGNNPWTAVQEFLKTNDDFIVDKEIEGRAIITSAPGGWLRRIK